MTRELTIWNRGFAAIAGYLLAMTTITVGHGLGWPTIHDVALTPRLFAEGKIWLLAASGFLADTSSTWSLLLSVVGVAVLAVYLGTRRFVLAAVVGHVGATVLTYAGIGALLLAHIHAAARLIDEPDYGISCVLAGALGAAAAQGAREPSRRVRLAVTSGAGLALAAMTINATGLALPEHVVAFLLGSLLACRGTSPALSACATRLRLR